MGQTLNKTRQTKAMLPYSAHIIAQMQMTTAYAGLHIVNLLKLLHHLALLTFALAQFWTRDQVCQSGTLFL